MSAAMKKSRPAGKLFKRLIAAPFVFVAAILILLEDWLWDDLARLAAAIGRLPVFHQVETLITKLPAAADQAGQTADLALIAGANGTMDQRVALSTAQGGLKGTLGLLSDGLVTQLPDGRLTL